MIRRRIFRRFLLSYLAVVVLTALVGSVGYLVSVQALYEQVDDRNLGTLRAVAHSIEIALSDVTNLAAKIATYPNVDRLMRSDQKRPLRESVLTIILTQNDLAYSAFTESTIRNVWLYSYALDMVLTPVNVMYDTEYLWNPPRESLRYQGVTHSQWRAVLRSPQTHKAFGTEVTVTDSDGVYRAIPYYLDLPLHREPHTGELIVMVDAISLLKVVTDMDLPAAAWFAIYGNAGRRVTDTPQGAAPESLSADWAPATGRTAQLSLSGIDYSLTSYASPALDFTYVLAYPTKELLLPVNRARTWIAAVLLALLALGAAMSVWFARRDTTPLARAFEHLTSFGEEETAGSPFEALDHGVVAAVTAARTLEERLRDRQQLLRREVLRLLLQGEGSAEEGFRDPSSEIDHALADRPSELVLFHAGGFAGPLRPEERQDLDRLSFTLRRLFEECNWDLHSQVSLATTAVLIPADEASGAETALARATDDTGEPLLVLRAETVSAARQLPGAYIRAMESLEAAAHAGCSGVVHASAFRVSPGSIAFSLETERSLIAAIKQGDEARTEEILDDLCAGPTRRRLAAALETTYDRVIDHSASPVSDASGGQLPPERLPRVRRLLLDEARRRAHARRQSYPAIDAAREYIDRAYGDPMLNLAGVADEFGFSEGHFSRLFKERVGWTFQSYLNEVRMNAAIAALRASDAPVSEIAPQHGYASTRVFRRAFKSYTGLTPSEFRRSRSAS